MTLPDREMSLSLSCEQLSSFDDSTLARLGAHLWGALPRPPRPVEEGGVLIRTSDPALATLPWHLLARGGVHLVPGVSVRVELLDGVAPPWSLAPSILVLDPGDGAIAEAWRLMLAGHPEHGSARATVIEVIEPDALLAALDGPDVLHLVVDGETLRTAPAAPTLPLVGGRGIRWQGLFDAITRNPPRLVILEVAGPAGRLLAGRAAALAAKCPAVSVLPVVPGEPPGEAGVHLGRMVWHDNLPLDLAHRVLIERETRGPACWPWTFGQARPPRITAEEPHQEWYLSDRWRVRLDRRKQTHVAMGEIRELGPRTATALRREDRPALVLIWHGPRTSDLPRYRVRLEQEIRRLKIPIEPVPLAWPKRHTADELAAVWATKLGLPDPALVPGALAGLCSPGTSEFGVVFASFPVGGAKTPAHLLGARELVDCLKAWRDLTRGFADRVLPVLGIAIEHGGLATELVRALPAAIKDRRGELRPLTVILLDELPDVVAEDVADLILEERAVLRIDPEAVDAVADEVIWRSKGVYEQAIRLVETLPWHWETLYAAAKARRKS